MHNLFSTRKTDSFDLPETMSELISMKYKILPDQIKSTFSARIETHIFFFMRWSGIAHITDR